uniref:Uncharacterized protein n=1 Tax=Arundo donax TaxID=35708 RepID=A0A0A9C7Q5_ARUDO
MYSFSRCNLISSDNPVSAIFYNILTTHLSDVLKPNHQIIR